MAFAARRLSQPVARKGLVVRAAATELPAKFSTVKPSGDRVLIKTGTAEAKSAGGILLPSAAETKKTEGEVVAVGDVKSLKVGDMVMYSQYAGTAVKMGKDENVIMKESDVIGVKGSNMADMKPTQDRILIKLAADEGATAGGVILTAQSSEKPTVGTVVAVGPGMPGENDEVTPVNVAVGAEVLYSKYTGVELEEGDDKFVVVREGDIMAVLS